MSRIDRISRLRGCRVFRNFAWPSKLPDFGQYNLIYGWNGTGKTTLSQLLRDLELRRRPTMGEAALCIDGSDLRGDDFPQSRLQVRVFNRDFIRDNVFPVGGGDMTPILVLGAENVEKQREVERLKKRRAKAQGQLDLARSAEQAAVGEFNRFCIGCAKLIKDALRAGGQNPYNNYNKADFRNDAKEMVGSSGFAIHRLADADHDRLLARHKGTSKPQVAELEYALPDFNTILDRVQKLLATTVVSAAIPALKADPSLSDWTHRGLMLHRERKADQCLFCNQSLPEQLLDALGAHFNDDYERLIGRIDLEIDRLETASDVSGSIQMPSAEELYDHVGPEFQSCARGLKDALASLREFLAASIQALEDKKLRPFDAVKRELDTPPVDADIVAKLNGVIRRHNEECGAFETGREDARNRLARHMIATELEEFVRLQDAVDQARGDRQENKGEAQRLDAEIAKLEREIVEHRRPAEDLNEDLRKYLGHGELCLEIKETGYTITRSGETAGTMSEGEKTAIALLYFLRSLQDRRFDLEHGVVVLDDPVSSLDSNALFLAFGFIREHTGEAGQLFILTHNFAFFRQIRNWFGHLNRGKSPSNRPARSLMLESTQEDNVRRSTIRGLDPLLAKYDSEYQYLFARIHQAATASASQDLEANYVLPNMARRMLEAFLAFRQPVAEGLWYKMKRVEFDEAKKHRIHRFLHTHSHSMAVGEPEHDLTALAEGPSVLNDLLGMIKSEDSKHFAAMVELVAPSADSGGGAS